MDPILSGGTLQKFLQTSNKSTVLRAHAFTSNSYSKEFKPKEKEKKGPFLQIWINTI